NRIPSCSSTYTRCLSRPLPVRCESGRGDITVTVCHQAPTLPGRRMKDDLGPQSDRKWGTKPACTCSGTAQAEVMRRLFILSRRRERGRNYDGRHLQAVKTIRTLILPTLAETRSWFNRPMSSDGK